MSTPTEANSADRELAEKPIEPSQEDFARADRVIRTISDTPEAMRLSYAHNFCAHRIAAVAEAVAGRDAEIKLARFTIEKAKAWIDEAKPLLERGGKAESERDSLRAKPNDTPEGRAEWCKAHGLPVEWLLMKSDEIAVIKAEMNGLKALVVRMRTMLLELFEAHCDGAFKDFNITEHSPEWMRRFKALIESTPADLADCVVVKRGEWEATNKRIGTLTASLRDCEHFLASRNLGQQAEKLRQEIADDLRNPESKGDSKKYASSKNANFAKPIMSALDPEAKGGA